MKQEAQLHDQLAVLAGQYPSQASPQTLQLSDLKLPDDLPLSLPSTLVAQRPDVLQAEANLHAASAQIGVAIANRLPNIELSANVGATAVAGWYYGTWEVHWYLPAGPEWLRRGIDLKGWWDAGTWWPRWLGHWDLYRHVAFRNQFVVLDQNNNPIPCPPGAGNTCAGVPYGTLDRTNTDALTIGASAQATNDAPPPWAR